MVCECEWLEFSFYIAHARKDVAHGHDHSHKKHSHDHRHRHSQNDSGFEGQLHQKEKRAANVPLELLPMETITNKPEQPPVLESEHSSSSSLSQSASGEESHKSRLGMKGVFLHLLGDALGSVAVMIVGFVLWKWPEWKYGKYLDPSLSVLVVAILLFSTVRLGRVVLLLFRCRN